MKKNLFVHLNETLTIMVQILDKDGNPVVLNDYDVEFSTSLENSTEAIETLTISEGIEIIDENAAIVEIKISALIEKGYQNRQHMYQLTTTNKDNNEMLVCLTGRLFISAIILTD